MWVGGQAAKNGLLVPKKGGHLTFHGWILPFDCLVFKCCKKNLAGLYVQ
jgi:hypothetical protein